jgi:hypothetical protein
MTKADRLSNIIQIYLEGGLELDTAAAELTHVFVYRGWRFSLVESDCEPRFRDRMRALAVQIDATTLARRESAGRATDAPLPIVIS